jgi:hypothetical protein
MYHRVHGKRKTVRTSFSFQEGALNFELSRMVTLPRATKRATAPFRNAALNAAGVHPLEENHSITSLSQKEQPSRWPCITQIAQLTPHLKDRSRAGHLRPQH